MMNDLLTFLCEVQDKEQNKPLCINK